MRSEQPFTADLANGVWMVSGTLQQNDGEGRTVVGGTAYVEISKEIGCVLKYGAF